MLGIPNPDPTRKVTDGLYVLRDGMGDFYAVSCGEELLLVDTGASPQAARREMGRLDLDPERVTAILLTHSDYDHVGGIGAFPRATLHIGRGEVPLMEGRQARSLGLVRNKPLPRAPVLVDDGFRLQVGPRQVEAISMPGHTPGSTAWRVDGRWLLVGDACTVNGGKADARPWILYMDRPRARESLQKVARLEGVELLCTCHSGVHPFRKVLP